MGDMLSVGKIVLLIIFIGAPHALGSYNSHRRIIPKSNKAIYELWSGGLFFDGAYNA